MAVHKENIVLKALDHLVVDGFDMGATFQPLVVSMEMNVEDVTGESSLTPIDSEISSRLYSAQVTLAEVKLGHLAVVLNLPVSNIVSSSSTLVLNNEDRGLVSWTAVGKPGSAPDILDKPSNETLYVGTNIRTFNFPRSRSVGTPTYNMAKLDPTNIPVEFRFYGDRTTGEAGTITDTENFLMLFDSARSNFIALDGAPTKQSIYTAVNNLVVKSIRVQYDEATSSHAGVIIRVGKIGNSSFYSSFISEPNKALGSVTNLAVLQTKLLAGETLTVECDGLKAGTGAVIVQVELEAAI